MPRDLPGATFRVTRNEAIYLSDNAPDYYGNDEAVIGARRFFLKLGSAILDDGGAEITFTHDELWSMRGIVKSGAAIGVDQVGRALIMKVYGALLEIANKEGASEIDHIVSMFGTRGDGNDTSTDEN